jgi:hypothetical protein
MKGETCSGDAASGGFGEFMQILARQYRYANGTGKRGKGLAGGLFSYRDLRICDAAPRGVKEQA